MTEGLLKPYIKKLGVSGDTGSHSYVRIYFQHCFSSSVNEFFFISSGKWLLSHHNTVGLHFGLELDLRTGHFVLHIFSPVYPQFSG